MAIIPIIAQHAFCKASEAGLSFGAVKEFIHSPESEGVVLRYDHSSRLGAQFMLWDGSESANNAVSLDYDFIKGRWGLFLGAAYLSKINHINGTRVNFILGLAYDFERLRIQYAHFSNGHNENNDGWNFIGLSYRF